MSDELIERRRFVKSTAALAITATGLAGCTGGGGGGGAGGDGGDGGGGGGGGGGTQSFGGWMENVGNYDGVVDETGSSEVTVTVGAQGNGGNFAFAPPAIRVSTGTSVVWEWNGKGGSHNVVAQSGADFESKLTAEKGFTFSRTFDSAGTIKYYCQPHKSLGMKGVVVVE